MQHSDGFFEGSEGTRLYLQAWRPDGTARAAIVISHGMGEHSARYSPLAARLAEAGYAVHALDHRGHGRSAGPRAYVARFELYVDDLDRLLQRVAGEHPGIPVLLLGHSMGGAIAFASAARRPDRLSALVLSAPALALGDAVPRWQVSVIQWISRLLPRLGVLRLPATDVSRDPAVVSAYESDPLVHHGAVPARTLAELMRTTAGFGAHADRLRLPVLVMHGTADRLVRLDAVQPVYARIASADRTIRLYEGLYHEIFNEPERERVIGDLEAWLALHTGDPQTVAVQTTA